MERYDDAGRLQVEALRDIALNIRDNASNYDEAEAINADAFKTIAPAWRPGALIQLTPRNNQSTSLLKRLHKRRT